MSKRILFLTNGYPTALTPGLCPFIKKQADDLRKEGLQVDVISSSEVAKFGYLYLLRRFFKVQRSYEVLHIHHGLVLLLLAPFLLLNKKKIVVSFLNNIEREYDELRFRFLRLALVFITKCSIWLLNVHVIEKNNRVKRNFKNYSVIPNGVNTDIYKKMDAKSVRKDLGLPMDKIILLFVASKNLDRAQKRKDRFDFLVQLSEKFYGLYASGITTELMVSYLNAADYHVIVSEMEGSPNSVKESIAVGTPVLALDVGDIRHIISGDKESRIFKTFDDMKEYFKLHVIHQQPLSTAANSLLIQKNGYDRSQIVLRLIELYNI